jgi:hypothetical protein
MSSSFTMHGALSNLTGTTTRSPPQVIIGTCPLGTFSRSWPLHGQVPDREQSLPFFFFHAMAIPRVNLLPSTPRGRSFCFPLEPRRAVRVMLR